MTASSQYNVTTVPSGGRLNYQTQYDDDGVLTQIGGWAPDTADTDQWLQVKFSQILQITGVATQGRADQAEWVTSYKLEYSTDGSTWTSYPDVSFLLFVCLFHQGLMIAVSSIACMIWSSFFKWIIIGVR